MKQKQELQNKNEEIENLKNQIKKLNTESLSTLDILKVEKLKSQKFQKLYQVNKYHLTAHFLIKFKKFPLNLKTDFKLVFINKTFKMSSKV